MRLLGKIKRLLVNPARRPQAEAMLEAELHAYQEELIDRNIAKGLPPQEARRQAALETGGIEQIKEEVRDTWIGHSVETVWQDFRYACRSLARSRGFTSVVIGTLALGIGANLTMFSLLHAVLWRSLPYPEANRIVMIQADARGVPDVGATPGEVLDLRDRSHSFAQISMIEGADADLEYQGRGEHLQGASVSDNFLPLLGAHPALGRTLDSRVDKSENNDLAVVISDDLWRRSFSADRRILGQAVVVNGSRVQIVGVLAPGFRLFLPPEVGASEQIDVWFPASLGPVRKYRGIPIAARLRPGVSLEQANAELQILAREFEREYPDFYSGAKGWQASPADQRAVGLHFTAGFLQERITREARPALLLLSGAVAFVLLIACVNIANLMLARGSARQREFEIRLALGAGSVRILRQILTECFVLATFAACLGLLLARVGLEAVLRLPASPIPLQSGIGVDVSVALFALALAVLTSLLFGLLPAWNLASGQTSQRRSGRTATSTTGARRTQRALVVAEIALSIVPLVCAGLMLRSFVNLLHTPLGFDPSNLLTVKAPVSLERYPQAEQRWAVMRDLLQRLRALPGVTGVSAASPLPLGGDQETRRVGRADQPDVTPILATQQGAAPGYLAVMGTRLLQGRDFQGSDIVPARNVTIIDEQLAKRLWPEGALGKRLVVYRTGWRHELEVIGVTAAVRTTRVRDEGVPHFMLPGESPMSLVIKTPASAAQMITGIQQAVSAAHTGRAAFDVQPMSDYVSASIGDTRFILLVLTTFAAASVLLTGMGLFGTLSYLTAQRSREFGIRLALGSNAGAILAIVMRESFALAVLGTALGLLGVVAATNAIRGLLYGVHPLDAATLAVVAGVVGVVALGAATVPAWRAIRIDPSASLRNE